jgi:transcriptional regulator with XRE-family HTH domain
MADYAAAPSIGARIAAARRARGYRSAADFERALEGTGITAAVLANIESGRKSDLDVSQLLNIARVLQVPPSFLLAPMARPGDLIDLPNLGTAFASMTAGEFDAWLSAAPTYASETSDERTDRAELQAFRDLRALERDLARLRVVEGLENGSSRPVEIESTMRARIESTEREIDQLRKFLTSAGWTF